MCTRFCSGVSLWIQLPDHGLGNAKGSPGAWASATYMGDLDEASDISLAQSWPLQSLEKWTSRCKICISGFQKSFSFFKKILISFYLKERFTMGKQRENTYICCFTPQMLATAWIGLVCSVPFGCRGPSIALPGTQTGSQVGIGAARTHSNQYPYGMLTLQMEA